MEQRGFMNRKKETFRCDLLKHLCCFSVTDMGWTKEINIVSWSGGRPVIDIRRWNADHTTMGKGISINYEELIWLHEALTEILKDEETLAIVKSRKLYRDILPNVNFTMNQKPITKEEEAALKGEAQRSVKEQLAINKQYPISVQEDEPKETQLAEEKVPF